MQADAMMIGEEEPSSLKAHHNPLEPFLLLAKGTHGAACADLIKTVLEATGVYVFAELLQHPHVIEVGVELTKGSNMNFIYKTPHLFEEKMNKLGFSSTA